MFILFTIDSCLEPDSFWTILFWFVQLHIFWAMFKIITFHFQQGKELFLDILTKEEKEALLTKKMEEIKKKNETLRKRHAVSWW